MEQNTLERAEDQASMCRLIGNPCRLLILWSLAYGEQAVNEIAARVGGTLQNISQHLSLLRRHGLIGSRREGRHIYYHINKSEWLENCLALSGVPGKRQETILLTTQFGG
jgi:ArsR family transcriptional regulator